MRTQPTMNFDMILPTLTSSAHDRAGKTRSLASWESPLTTASSARARLIGVSLILLLVLAGGQQACPAAEAYESLTLGETTYRNVRVVATNAAEIVILFDGGGATVDRRDLPPDWQVRYPYDAEKAGTHLRQKAAARAAEPPVVIPPPAESGQAARTYLRRQEHALIAQVHSLEQDLEQINREIQTLNALARRKRVRSPERQTLDRALVTRINLQRRIEVLERQLEGVHALQGRVP
jgi:hypothetical protein